MSIPGYDLEFWDKDLDDEALWQQSVDLMYGAFDWPASRGTMMELLRADPRHARDPVATYATDSEGDLAGYVGIARRPVVHEGEVLPSGHLWTVAVRQDHTRHGIGTALIKMAIEQLKGEGIEEITLYSTPGLVAYPIYRRMGFLDHHRLAFWLSDARPDGTAVPMRRLAEEELGQVISVWDRHMAGVDGFTVREDNPYAVITAMGSSLAEMFYTVDPPGALEGFVNMSAEPMRGLTVVREIVGPDADWYRQAIGSVRATAKGDQVVVTHRNPGAVEGLEAAGFRWNDVHAFERMMAVGRIVEEDEVASDPAWFAESRLDVF
ncbi:MAG: GNAT family N-acetyltransferase [Planctomycetota bacterium]|jgi:GNAT superfamily N-acetyltransferase